MKRLLVLSAVVGLATALLPLSGAADATTRHDSTSRASAGQPAHRLDLLIKRQNTWWIGGDVYGPATSQQVTGKLPTKPGRTVALIKVVNTGTKRTPLVLGGSSLRGAFYGGADWPTQGSLAPGESVTFKYVGHRGTAEDGESMPMDFATPDDSVRFLLKAT